MHTNSSFTPWILVILMLLPLLAATVVVEVIRSLAIAGQAPQN